MKVSLSGVSKENTSYSELNYYLTGNKKNKVFWWGVICATETKKQAEEIKKLYSKKGYSELEIWKIKEMEKR